MRADFLCENWRVVSLSAVTSGSDSGVVTKSRRFVPGLSFIPQADMP